MQFFPLLFKKKTKKKKLNWRVFVGAYITGIDSFKKLIRSEPFSFFFFNSYAKKKRTICFFNFVHVRCFLLGIKRSTPELIKERFYKKIKVGQKKKN